MREPLRGHSIAHVLGAKYHIVHGEAVGYALPAVMEFVAPVRAHKVREIGQILGAVYPENAPDEQGCDYRKQSVQGFPRPHARSASC